MWHVWGSGEVQVGFGGKRRERDHLENLVVDGIIILKWIFRKWDGIVD